MGKMVVFFFPSPYPPLLSILSTYFNMYWCNKDAWHSWLPSKTGRWNVYIFLYISPLAAEFSSSFPSIYYIQHKSIFIYISACVCVCHAPPCASPFFDERKSCYVEAAAAAPASFLTPQQPEIQFLVRMSNAEPPFFESLCVCAGEYEPNEISSQPFSTDRLFPQSAGQEFLPPLSQIFSCRPTHTVRPQWRASPIQKVTQHTRKCGQEWMLYFNIFLPYWNSFWSVVVIL